MTRVQVRLMQGAMPRLTVLGNLVAGLGVTPVNRMGPGVEGSKRLGAQQKDSER